MARTIRNVVGLVALGGAGFLFWYAASVMPVGEHHGEAVDGLDGLGTFFGLVSGGGGVVLLVIGVLLFRSPTPRVIGSSRRGS